MAATGLSLSRIAEHGDMPDTTLTRFYNHPEYRGTLNQMTVQRISDAFGIPGPGMALNGTGREEAQRLQDKDVDERVQVALANLIAGRRDAYPWRMKTDGLVGAGVHIGDILIIDQSELPRDGDVVCAQIEVGYGAQTVFRLYQQPYLVGAGHDPRAVRPELVDNSRVRIAGTMTDLIRQRP